MRFRVVLAAAPLCLVLATAQEAPSKNETKWSGILADAKCNSTSESAALPKSTASSAEQGKGTSDPKSLLERKPGESKRTWNSTDPNTAGNADRNGAGTAKAPGESAGKQDMDKKDTEKKNGSADRTAGRDVNLPRDAADNRRSSTWDQSCFVSPATTSFVLELQDGRTLKLDDANKIGSRLKSSNRAASKGKIFRVKVTGTLDGDTIHVTDIEM